jgi:hypothetical protein
VRSRRHYLSEIPAGHSYADLPSGDVDVGSPQALSAAYVRELEERIVGEHPSFTFSGSKSGLARQAIEEELIDDCFDSIGIGKDEHGRIIALSGSVVCASSEVRDFLISVPKGYPYKPPEALAVGWPITGWTQEIRHSYNEKKMCLFHPNSWSSRRTLAYVVTKTYVWIQKYDIYRSTGSWPGLGQAH